jgi:hypothetical protein
VISATVNVRPANSGDIYYLQDYNIFVDWQTLLKDNKYNIYVAANLVSPGLNGYAICRITHIYIVEEIYATKKTLIDFLIDNSRGYGLKPIFKVFEEDSTTQVLLRKYNFVAFKSINGKVLFSK